MAAYDSSQLMSRLLGKALTESATKFIGVGSYEIGARAESTHPYAAMESVRKVSIDNSFPLSLSASGILSHLPL